MAHHKSTIKRIKTDAKRRSRNTAFKSEMKTNIKKVLESKEKAEAEILYRQTTKLIDQVASKKIIHKKRAASHKSKLALHVNSLN